MLPLSAFDIAEILALAVGLWCLPSLKEEPISWLVWLLVLVVTAELFGRYERKVLHHPNAWIFNISTNIEFIVYGILFYKVFAFSLFRRMVLFFLFLYPVLAFLNMALIQGFTSFHSYSMSIGSLFMILFCCCYFYEILYRKEKMQLLLMPFFWVATGLLFFYTGDLLYNLFFNFFIISHYDYKPLFRAINNNLIIVLYSCFIMAFLCKKLQIKYSSG